MWSWMPSNLAPAAAGGVITPHFREVPIPRKMLRSPFFAEHGLL
jgi:hypothetical protein